MQRRTDAGPGRLLGASLLAAALMLLLSASATLATGPGHAGGNNGTVKVHESTTRVEFMRNEPHVCSFYLAFYSSDPAQSGSWEIRDWTGARTVVASGTYLTDSDGFYRTQDMVLEDGHYRVNWQGINDTSWKHKMFWVDCDEEVNEGGQQPAQPPDEGGEQGAQSGGEGAAGGGQGAVAASQGGPEQGELPDTAMTPQDASGGAVALGVLILTLATALVGEHRRRQGLSV